MVQWCVGNAYGHHLATSNRLVPSGPADPRIANPHTRMGMMTGTQVDGAVVDLVISVVPQTRVARARPRLATDLGASHGSTGRVLVY